MSGKKLVLEEVEAWCLSSLSHTLRGAQDRNGRKTILGPTQSKPFEPFELFARIPPGARNRYSRDDSVGAALRLRVAERCFNSAAGGIAAVSNKMIIEESLHDRDMDSPRW